MKFLLEAEYTTNYTRKFADKDHEAIVQNLSKNYGDSLLAVKTELEKEYGRQAKSKYPIKYNSLNDSQRSEFIGKVIDKSKNSKILRQARKGIIDSIQKSNWNQSVIDYLDKLKNQNIQDSEVILISDLLTSNKINSNASWLYDNELYNRDISDALYTIKALTLAGNDSLQKNSEGGNRYFKDDNPLTIKDFYDEDNKLKQASEIEDIISSKEDPSKGVDFSDRAITKDVKQRLKDIANKNNVKVDVDDLVDKQNIRIKEELQQLLASLGVGKQEAADLIKQGFEEGKTTEYLLNKILKNRG